MQIRMLETKVDSPDGKHDIVYGVNTKYFVPDTLGKKFIKLKIAKEVKENGKN